MAANNMAICVASPNSYADVFGVFYQCFKKYWTDCPYELILSTNSQQYDGITVLNNYQENDTWTMRMLDAVNHVHTKYILMICDDIMIANHVDNTEIENILKDMEKYQIKFVGLANCLKGNSFYPGSLLDRVKFETPYSRNLQCGIYEKSYFLKYLSDPEESAWSIESRMLEENRTRSALEGEIIASVNKNVLNQLHGVYKGRWYKDVVVQLRKKGIIVKSDRGYVPLKIIIRNHLIGPLGKKMSGETRNKLKSILHKFGFKFATNN